MASKNEDVHLRLFFDGAKAAKTYDLLTRLQEEYNKKMEEAKNIAKSKGVDPKNDADYKYWKGQLAIVKSMLKEAKKSYTDVHRALSSLSLQSMADLNAYIKYLEHRINSMSMKKKGAAQELAKLQSELAQFTNERDMRKADAPSRTLAQIQQDLAKSDNSVNKLRVLRQELETLKNTTTNASTREGAIREITLLDERLKQMNAKPLRDLQTVIANIGNANNGSITRLKELREELVAIQQTSTNSRTIQQATDEIAKLDVRLAEMQKVSKRPMAEVLGEIGTTKSIEGLERLRKEIEALYKSSTNSGDQQKLAQGLRDVDAAIKKIGEAPKRPLGDIMKDIDAAMKNGSLERLEALRVEIGNVFRSLTDQSEAQKARAKMEQLDLVIKNFGKETVDAMAVLKDPKNFNLSQVTAAIRQLEEQFERLNVGAAQNVSRQKMADDIRLLKEYADNAKAALNPLGMNQTRALDIATGASATAAELREAIKLMTEFRDKNIKTSDTKAIDDYNQWIASMSNRLKEATESKKQFMDIDLARALANGAIVGTVSELKEAKDSLENFKGSLQTTDTHQLEAVNVEIKSIDNMLKQANGDMKALMDAPQALEAISDAKKIIADIRKDPNSVGANVANEALESIKRAQSAMGISVQTSQEAVAVERALTEAMKGKNVAVISAAEAARAEANAKQILTDKEKADADTVRDTIELYKQMLLQGGHTIEQRTVLTKQLEQMEKLYKGNADAATKYNATFVKNTLDNITTAPIQDLEKAMKMLQQKMKDVKRETEDEVKEYVRLRQEYNKTKSALDALNGTKQKAAKQTKTLSTRIKEQTDAISRATGKLMQYLGVFGGFYLVRNQMEKVFEANMRYDDSLTNIRKTTQMTSEAVAVLANEIKHIDTRTSVEEMTNLAYAAGKLGVKGVSDVLSFVRAADQIKVALGEQLGDGAAAVEQIYKVANVMGDIQQYGMEEALEKVGSSINYLTMQTQATAQPMIDMMKRLSGVGRQAGMSTADLVGWAGATNALGQNTELAATALSRVMVQLSKNHKAVAQALNMTKEETEAFRYDISTGRISEAMLKVLQMGKERGGLSQLGLIIKDLSGSDGARAIQVLSTLSSNYETVASMVRMSNNAFDEGTSVTDEYNLKQQNTTALLEKLKNGFSKLFTSTEYIDYINKLLRSMQDLPEAANRIVHSLSWLGTIFKGVIGLVTNLTSVFEGMANGMVWRAMAQGVMNVGNAFVSFGTSMRDASKEFRVEANRYKKHMDLISNGATGAQLRLRKAAIQVRSFTAALRSMGTAGVLNVVFLVTSVISGAVAAYRNWREESQKWTRSFNEDLGRVEAQSKITSASLNKIEKAWKDAGDSELKHKDILIELNSTYGAFIDNLIDEKTKYEDIARAIKAANAELENKAILEARQNKINEIEEENADKLNENINSSLKRIVRLAKFVREIEETDKNGNVTTKTVTVGHDQMTADEKLASAAAVETAVQSLLADTDLMQSLYMVSKRDKDLGRAEEYGVGLRGTTAELAVTPEALNKLKVLFKDLGIADTQSNWKEVLFAMNDAVNTQTKTLNLQDDAMRAYNSKAQVKTNPTYQDTMDLVKESWLDVVDSVTKNGKYAFSRYSAEDEEVKKGTKKEGEAKPYHGKEQDNYYSDVKDAFGTTRKGLEQRKELSTKLERFIENAQRGIALLESRRYTDKAAQQQYEQLSYQLQSAQAEYKVVGIGKIDNVEPNGSAGKAARDAKQEMDNLIQKIKTFYEIQEEEFKRMRLDEEITEAGYQDRMSKNAINRANMLAAAYKTIAGDLTKDQYDAAVASMKAQNVAGEIGMEAFTRVENVGYKGAKHIGEIWFGSEADGSATINTLRRKAAEQGNVVKEEMLKSFNEIHKMLLENNPLGKLTDEYQKRFENLGLMLADFTKHTGDDLHRLENEAMNAYLTVGQNTNKFDISTDSGLMNFAESLEQIDIFKDQIQARRKEVQDAVAEMANASDDAERDTLQKQAIFLQRSFRQMLEGIYYLSYNYAEQFDEQITRIVERDRRLWSQQYKASDQAQQMKEALESAKEYAKEISRFEKFGFSSRAGLAQAYSNATLDVRSKTAAWQNNIDQARDKVQSRRDALSTADEQHRPQAEMDLKEAEEELRRISEMPDDVRSAVESMTDAMRTLQDATNEWVASMVDSFGKFMDGFIPFRTWYSDKDSFAQNVFGTKEERQKAFGEFMDDIKKTVRAEIMERTKLALTKKLLEKGVTKAAKEENKAQAQSGADAQKQITASAAASGEAQQQVGNLTSQLLQESSEAAKKKIIADNTEEATAVMWGNFGQAMTEAWAVGGPYLGPVLAATVSAAVGGLITMVMNMLGSKKKSSVKTKLVSGMLTYDSGNVQSFPVMGDDGRVYMASRGGVPASGTGIVRRPTLTTVGGAPALVAERGPEMVIGRETTHAMMMSRPDLLRAIVEFDRNRSRGFAKTFDSGNVSQMATVPEGSPEGNNQQLMEVLDAQTAMLSQMYEINAALTAELRKGIGVRKYGAGGLIEETAAGFAEAKRSGNNKNITRLFGGR